MAHGWGYTLANGPQNWCKDFPIAKGERQSPIDIVTSQAVHDPALQGAHPLTCEYQTEKGTGLKNNGHSVCASIKQKSYLTGGPLTGKYQLEQFHLHWGASSDKGSEHFVDGKSYAAELHLVHWNCEKYSSFAEAVDKPDGLAVLGIFIKEGNGPNKFSAISDQLQKVKDVNGETNLTSDFNPECLLPGNIKDYWTYLGSLTTPPLLESVTWIVFKEPVEYSSTQLTQLRNLQSSDGCCMVDNFRPPLQLGKRKLSKSFK